VSWLNKVKNAAIQTKEKLNEVDTGALVLKAKASSSDAMLSISNNSTQALGKVKTSLEDIDTQQLIYDTKSKAIDLTAKGKTFADESLDKSKSAIENIDWKKVTDGEHQKENFIKYWQAGTKKLNKVARSTLEIDRNTMDMVSDLQGRLPVPAQTMDDIFSQCRKVALQRATAAFFLSGAAESIDHNSAEKYENLSESYKEYSDRIGGHNIRSHENFSKMQDLRSDARSSFGPLENGYNKAEPLHSNDADIEHIISAKETYESSLLRAGTKDQGMIDAINSEDNLIFTNSSVNRSKGAVSLSDFLEKSEPHPTKEGVRTITINGETHEISEANCEAALDKATKSQNHHTAQAAMEIGLTAAKTGATMAVQQVVGMIVVETIDIFMEEIQRFTKEFKLFDEIGLFGNVQELNERLSDRLSQRFEERKIWEKARSLGVEAGVSGALSVIPQILISTLIRLPAFALGMIREGTLSCVRSARILASNDQNKLQSISIIMASTAFAVAGLYVSRVISTAISSVPLLHRFNNQITSVLSGLTVTALPLIAIYVFDQNKNKLVFALTNKQQEQVS
jgi:hypothetical protein